MTLSQYISSLTAFVVENPETSNYIVVTADDEEGNNYTRGCSIPTVGRWVDGDFIHYENLDEYDFDEEDDENFPHAVCIN